MEILTGKNVLITGGTGFLGEELVARILTFKPSKLRVMSRNEGKLISLKQKFPEIETYPGDISNQFDVNQASKGINVCFHLAAFKHVGMAEKFSLECTRSNVIGTINVLEESVRNKFEMVIGISTDKAAQVSGVYGATKLLMERLFKQYEELNSETSYRIVRYGNVLYSTGSVLCKWKELLQKDEEIIITDPGATRFFWTREQAIDLIFSCIDNAKNSDPWVPEMKSMSMGDLLTAMSKKYLPKNGTLKIKEIGLQPGENLHEKIMEAGPDSNQVEKFSIEEIIGMI